VAALLNTVLLVELDGVIDLHERRHDRRLALNHARSGRNRRLHVLVRALAAAAIVVILRSLSLARRLVTLKFALRARAGGGLTALPVALGLLAHRGAHGLRGNARRTAVRGRANGLALRAVLGFAHPLGAADIALRLVAVHLATRARGLLALDLALGALAHRVALRGASRVIALPSALRMALLGLHLGRRNNSGEREQQHERELHHGDENGVNSERM